MSETSVRLVIPRQILPDFDEITSEILSLDTSFIEPMESVTVATHFLAGNFLRIYLISKDFITDAWTFSAIIADSSPLASAPDFYEEIVIHSNT